LFSTIPASCSWRSSSPCVTGPVEGSVSPSGCEDAICATDPFAGVDEPAASGRCLPVSMPTVTVSMRPAPLGPSTISVLSDTSSFCPRLCSHGMGVRSAPPRDSSEPRVGVVELIADVVPLRSPPDVGRTANGRGNKSSGDDTETTRSSARRYGGRYLYLFRGSRTNSANLCTVCGGFFAKFLASVALIVE
jgi:hypothetical protein